ncbi:TetR family transcriptional regulator [Sinosporangium siamense]|uniref:TetR family transcriptional regulator n=2 Tax=Sinosporangium siamense TaxID=1367973 RepID=A0A919REX0_9ACTN|nr:TetR family transcriptional regulator [Sinosporangium siamense]
MSELATAIGISRATLHRHFATREELILTLGHRSLANWARALQTAGIAEAAEGGDPERIGAALHHLIEELVADAEDYGFALTDHQMERIPELVERVEALSGIEEGFYAAAQRAGVLRADMPVRWIGCAMFGLLIAVRDTLRRGDIARNDAVRLVRESFLAGHAQR